MPRNGEERWTNRRWTFDRATPPGKEGRQEEGGCAGRKKYKKEKRPGK